MMPISLPFYFLFYPIFGASNVLVISVTSLISDVTDAESCPNQNVTDWAGTFQPSSYPADYAPNLDCYWLIQVSDGNLIEINFQDFAVDIEIYVSWFLNRIFDIFCYRSNLQQFSISLLLCSRWTVIRYA